MRRLITTLAAGAAFIGLAGPAAATTSSTATTASSSAVATQYRGDCYRGESFSECRRRIQQQQNRYEYERYDPYRYGYDNRYQYNPYNYGQYDNRYDNRYDYNRYGQYDYNRYGYDYGRHYNNYGNSYGYGSGYGVDAGTALALTILGSALGVDIMGTVDDRDYYNRYRYDDNWRRWCSDRYRSFDWRSGTYLHNDGYRRYCRMY